MDSRVQRKRIGLWVVVAATSLVLWAAPAEAQPRAQLKVQTLSAKTGGALEARLVGKRVLRRGSIKSLARQRITVGGKSRTVGEMSATLFVDQDAFTAELKQSRAALLADPVEETEAIELENATILIKSTTVIVVDPVKLSRTSKTFRSQQRKGKRGVPKVSELSGASAKAFATFKQDLANQPRNHPLRVAAAKGDAELLKAISEGKGELTVTTEVVMPKQELSISNGQIQLPTYSGGQLNYGTKRSKKLGFSTGSGPADTEEVQPAANRVSKSGEVNFTAKFLTGKTIGDSFEWSRTWKFPSGHFRLSAGAYYGFGLRAPIELSGVMTPKKLTVTGRADKKRNYNVVVSAKTLDADAGFYRRVGLAEGKVFNGKELVIEAGFHLGYSLKAGFGALKKSGKIGKDFDFGKNFVPPFGNCGSRCGFDAWIPAELTRTKLHIGTKKIFVEGKAQLGFRIAGKGTIRVHYESLYGNGNTPSLHNSKTKRQHLLVLENSNKKRIQTELVPMTRPSSKKYGLHFWEPKYKWDVKATPGVKVTVDVQAGNWIHKSFVAGPLWLDSLAMDLGTVSLPHHKGTKKSFRSKHGEKTYIKN